jgi:hypothetical protein
MKKKRRRAFKTSPSIRVPRAAVEKLQESKAQAQAQAQAQAGEITRLKASVSAAAHDNAIYVEALRDLVRFYDKVCGKAGDGVGWTVAEVKRIEEIRLLSLGI